MSKWFASVVCFEELGWSPLSAEIGYDAGEGRWGLLGASGGFWFAGDELGRRRMTNDGD